MKTDYGFSIDSSAKYRHLGGVVKKVVKQTDIENGKYWAAIHSHNLPPFDGSIGTAGKSGSSEKSIRYLLSVSLQGSSDLNIQKYQSVST